MPGAYQLRAPAVRPSVRPSVTRRYHVQITERSSMFEHVGGDSTHHFIMPKIIVNRIF